MKLTQMIHDTVVAFEPRRNPVPALVALAMCLLALVALAGLAYLCGAGAAGAFKSLW